MSVKNTSWKTTMVGIIGLVLAIILIVLVYLKIISMSDFAVGLASLSTFLGIILSVFAKDSDKTGLPQ